VFLQPACTWSLEKELKRMLIKRFKLHMLLIIWMRNPSSAFHWSQKCVTLSGYFRLNSAFEPVRLASETATFESNFVKTNKSRPTLLAAKCSAESLDSGNIRFVRIFVWVPCRGTSNENLVFEMGFLAFPFEYLRYLNGTVADPVCLPLP